MLFYGILQAGFTRLFGNKRLQVVDLYSTMVQDLVTTASTSSALAGADDPEPTYMTSPTENLVTKVLRVRSKKAFDWMTLDATPSELAVAVCATIPVQKLTAWSFKQQHEKTWLKQDATQRPLVNFVTPRFSPAVQCVRDFSCMLESLPADAFPLLDGAKLNYF
jgi:hypothetical protein